MMKWQPWITSATEIRSVMDELPESVLVDLWKRLRPELCLWLDNNRKNINEKGFRLAGTGYIQQLRMVQDVAADGDGVTLSFFCKSQSEMKPLAYDVSVAAAVVLKKVETVTATSCSCKAGLNCGTEALCKHVFAVLYVLRSISDGGDIPVWTSMNLPCTSREQVWGKPSAAAMQKILRPGRADIHAAFLKPVSRKHWKPDLRSRIHPDHREISSERMKIIREFLSDTTLFPPTLIRLVEPQNPFLRRPRLKSPELENPYATCEVWPDDAPGLPVVRIAGSTTRADEHLTDLPAEEYQFYSEKVLLAENQNSLQQVEQTTRLQSECLEWRYNRSIRLTSSSLKKVVNAMEGRNAYKADSRTKLAKSLVSPVDISHIPAVKRGSELEPVAARFFCQKMSVGADKFSAYRIGLCVHPTEQWFGASPDRLIRIENTETGVVLWALLEIKSFASGRSVQELPYISTTPEVGWQLKRNHEYYFQVQSAMECAGVDLAYFLAFANESEDYFLEKIQYDSAAVTHALDLAAEFFFRYFLTELLAAK